MTDVTPDTSLAANAPRQAWLSFTLTDILAFGLIGGAAALGFVWLSSGMVATFRTSPSWLISASCYALFILPVYFLHRRFSFRSAAPHRYALPRYVATQLSALVLAAVFSFVAYGVFALPTTLAAMLVIGLTSALNFVVLRVWAFATG